MLTKGGLPSRERIFMATQAQLFQGGLVHQPLPDEGDSSSPQQIDEIIQAQGKDLLELLQLFMKSASEPLSSFLLQTPKHKGKDTNEVFQSPSKMNGLHQVDIPLQINNSGTSVQRQSSRLKAKGSKCKPVIKLAQELVAKKWGIVEEEKEMDSMTLQQYIDMYKQPLNEEAIDAIQTLTKVADDVNSKKKDKKKKKEGADCNVACHKEIKNPSMQMGKNSSVLVDEAEA